MYAAAFLRHLAAAGLCRYDDAGPDGAPLGYMEGTPGGGDYLAVYVTPSTAPGLSEWAPVIVRAVTCIDGERTGVGRNRAGWQHSMQVLDALHGLADATLDPGGPDELDVSAVWARGDVPVPLDPDTRGVPRWSASFEADCHHPSEHREGALL